MTLYNALTEMLNELESHQLQVALVPAKEPKHSMHFIRVAVDKNPKWYRGLCSRYPSSRRRPKFDTKIRRYDTLRTLTRLLDGNGTSSRYAQDLIRIARNRTK